MFKKFMKDNDAVDMYVTGAAGTGKTHQCREDVQYCMDNEIPYVVCAYTHRACEILSSKLPKGANVKTLHSFLGKRPTVNQHATKLQHVSNSAKVGDTDEEPKVLFLDEYSMIGEKDWLDIEAANIKVVWLGDRHQLPPVGDVAAVKPYGDYQKLLTKQWRNDNPLQIPLNALISFLEGRPPTPLKAVEGFFIRKVDIVKAYLKHDDAVILAYTNKRVQQLNALAQGYEAPKPQDSLFSPTTRQELKFLEWVDPASIASISVPRQPEPLELGTKYKTLEFLKDSGTCQFAHVVDEYDNMHAMAVVFGHYAYKVVEERLMTKAVESNAAIEKKFKQNAAGWARNNSSHKLAKARGKAWRDYLNFNECVICIDFSHAMTVHKSQGSTFTVVCLDTDNLTIAMQDFQLYLKLMYVGISRAAKKVYTS